MPKRELANNDEALKFLRLQRLYKEAKELREALGFDAPGTVTWYAQTDLDRSIEVIADGLGGATVYEFQGNNPNDHLVIREQTFEYEEDACELAAKWAGIEEE